MALVLVVDDDEVVARLIAEVVEFCAHTPLIANEPFLAAAVLRQQTFGAVLSDYMMPRLNGVDLLAIAMEVSPRSRRVLITAAPQEEEVRQAFREGIVQMVISKPPSIADIRAALGWLI